MLTKEEYAKRLKDWKQISEKVMKELFNNKYFCETIQIHSFAIRREKGKEDIYFEENRLSEEEISRKPSESNSSLMRRFLQNKEAEWDKKFVLEIPQKYKTGEGRCVIHWFLSCESLGDHCGTLVLYSAFSYLTGRFYRYLGNPNLLSDDSAEVREIVKKVEEQLEWNIQRMFTPFDFNLVNALSGEYYEKSECQANMFFMPHNIGRVLTVNDWVYQFEPIDFVPSKNRLLRKLLQMTRDNLCPEQDNLCLVLEADEEAKLYKVIGICKEKVLNKKITNGKNNMVPCIKVKIRAHMMWDIFLDDAYLLSCQNGHFKMNLSFKNPAVKKCLADELTKYFGKSADDYKTLCENIYQSTRQRHGTMLVIMNPETADVETKRLGERQYGLAARVCRERTDDINNLNAIDGSIIMDTDGRIYGIGMILDGMSEEKGDLSRGARYNSAVKYCDFLRKCSSVDGQTAETRGMILIVSEDGAVDILSA